MSLNRKEIIADNFGSNVHNYETHAKIQHKVATRLCDMISSDLAPANILEIGCGTGYLTEKLIQKFPESTITAIDISSKMIHHCAQKFENITALQMDGEALTLNKKFDLIVSNMSVQWFEHPVQGIDQIKDHLNQNGHLFYSTIGQNNFIEWKKTLGDLNLPNGLIHIPNYEDITQEELLTEKHSSVKEFLKSLHKIGAHKPREGYQRLSSSEMKKACAEFDKNYDGTISWHILYGHFKRI